MEALSKFLISLLELIEAELRSLRLGSAKLVAAVLLMLIATVAAVGGIALVVAGVYWALVPLLGTVLTFVALGAACVILSALLFSAALHPSGDKK